LLSISDELEKEGRTLTLDSRRFRTALGQFPTGVIIVTAQNAEGERLGMTMSSFNSVSLDPPLVLFSVRRESTSLVKWQQCSHYAINVLNEEQEELSNRFARSTGAKWDGVIPITGKFGAPILPNSLVAFECETYARYDGGDHEIFVAKVLALHENPTKFGQPILFFDGRYRRLDSKGASHVAAIDATYQHGW
jgi:flavin reductase (DIM6/NTAB) family NADH-FMN oxidoreductase RutF